MSRQLDYYRNHREEINAKRRKADVKRKAVKRTVEKSYSIQQLPSSSSRLYLHRLYLTYPITQQAQRSIGSTLQLSYNRQELFKVEGISCRLTTKHLIVEGIQLRGSLDTPASELRNYAEQLGDRIAQEAASNLSLQINVAQRESKLVEIAITEHEGAKGLTDRQEGRIILYQDIVSKKVVWADRTPNPASLESNADILLEPWRKFTKDLEEGGWENLKEITQNIVRIQDSQLKWFQHHDKLIQETTTLIKKLNQKRLL